jgi:hypothetical protein
MLNLIKQCLVPLLLICTLAACQNKSKAESDDEEDTGLFYYDYLISGEEGQDSVTVMLQYRQGGRSGKALALPAPTTVTLDQELLPADSTKQTGVFYEVRKPLQEFAGDHRIVVTGGSNERQEQNFSFVPFGLAAEFAEKIKQQPFAIRLTHFPDSPERIRLVIVDTSFVSKDVNEEMKIEQGEIKVTRTHLSKVVKGPVTLEIYHEHETPLKNASKTNGRLLVSYGLRRQFELVD